MKYRARKRRQKCVTPESCHKMLSPFAAETEYEVQMIPHSGRERDFFVRQTLFHPSTGKGRFGHGVCAKWRESEALLRRIQNKFSGMKFFHYGQVRMIFN